MSEFLDLLENLEPVNRSEKNGKTVEGTPNDVTSKFRNRCQAARIAFLMGRPLGHSRKYPTQ